MAKTSLISKRGTPKKLGRNRASQKTVKGRGRLGLQRKGKSATRKNQGRLRGGYEQKVRRRKELEQERERIEQELQNLEIEASKSQELFSDSIQPETKRWIKYKEGVRIKEKKLKGFHNVYWMKFPKGDFDAKVNFANNVDLSFLNHAIKRRSVPPRAVYVTLEFRRKGNSRFYKQLSPPEFVVNLMNIKKFLVEQMIEAQDRFLINILDKGSENFLTESDKMFAPRYLYAVSFEFIY